MSDCCANLMVRYNLEIKEIPLHYSAKKVAKAEVKAHEKRMHKMAKGGVTGEAMRKYGRNLARAMNQKSTGRGK